jgi:3-carboxy-cis,cis-muconate cycloisomerase
MAFSALDSQLYGSMFADPDVTQIFSDSFHIQSMLQIEAALARAQGKLGVIPLESADAIDNATRTLEVDVERLKAGIQNDGFPVIELVRQLREHVANNAADFVHFGATTQDILDSARVLQLRAALINMRQVLKRLIACLAVLAQQHQHTLMSGRTHTQVALPITFGFKVASWLAPLIRDYTRLQELEPRLLVVQFGGAVGTLAALGNRGFEVSSALAAELDLNMPLMPWHTQRDSIAELAGWLCLVSGSLGKIAQDVLLLAQSEIAEVRESADASRGGSSTMPQKTNPITSEFILTAARMNTHLLGGVFQTMLHEQERGTHSMQLEWLTLGQMIGLTSGVLQKSAFLCQNMVVNQEKMLKNLKATNGLMLSEALSFALADFMDRTAAKKLCAEIVQEALNSQRHLLEVAKERVGLKLDWENLTEKNNLGSSDLFIARVIKEAKRIENE